ncbi:hypothetical protein HOD29_01920 [archaeon]|jgi:hypothetical protein|nr:hypothetical protein [archaeon]
MNKKLLSVFMFGFILLATGFVSAEDVNDTMVVKTNVLKSVVSISVPEEVIFQDIAKGYVSERNDLDIKNTGTVDISVTPELATNYSSDIFDYISFQEVLADPLTKIRYFDFEILKPTVIGGERSQGIYMYLDLEEYAGEITEDMMDHQTEVIFWAVPL